MNFTVKESNTNDHYMVVSEDNDFIIALSDPTNMKLAHDVASFLSKNVSSIELDNEATPPMPEMG